MPRKNVCIACPTHTKEGFILLVAGFVLAFQQAEIFKTTGVFLIFLAYILPYFRSRLNKKQGV